MIQLTRLVVVAAMVITTIPVAEAQRPPTKEAIAIAKRHFEQAEAYFKANVFDRAAAEYLASYEQSNEPALLFNIGLAWENHDDFDKAITYYDRYLTAVPSGAKAAEARARRDVLVRKVEARAEALRTEADRAAAEKAAADKAAADKVAADKAAADKAAADKAAAEKAAADQAAADKAAAGNAPSMIPAIVAYGAGALALGIAINYGLEARSIGEDLERDLDTGRPVIDTEDPRFDEGASATFVANVSFGAAAVATLVGAYFTYRVIAAKRTSSTVVAPSISSDGAGVSIGGRW